MPQPCLGWSLGQVLCEKRALIWSWGRDVRATPESPGRGRIMRGVGVGSHAGSGGWEPFGAGCVGSHARLGPPSRRYSAPPGGTWGCPPRPKQHGPGVAHRAQNKMDHGLPAAPKTTWSKSGPTPEPPHSGVIHATLTSLSGLRHPGRDFPTKKRACARFHVGRNAWHVPCDGGSH